MSNKEDKQNVISELFKVIKFLQDDNVLLERSDIDLSHKFYDATEGGTEPISSGKDFMLSISTVYIEKKHIE